jgi:pilus assembly protein Flp/PilA
MMFQQFVSKFHREESGQDLVEYALVLVAVATGVIAGSSTLATDFGNWMATLNTKINSLI